jgi:hypothetical protein
MADAKKTVAALMKDYDPDSDNADDIALKIAANDSLLAVLTRNQRRLLVLGLFSGNTPKNEEDAAMLILRDANKSDLKWVIKQIGWSAFYSELDTLSVAKLRGRTGDVTDFNPSSNDADDIAQIISSHPTWIQNFTTHGRVVLVRALFNGATDDDEETAAMRILRTLYAKPSRLKAAVRAITWGELESELDADELAELRMTTLDFKDFDSSDSFADDIAVIFANHDDVLKKLTRQKRALLIEALLGDKTFEEEEVAARDILVSEPTGDGLIKLCCKVGGWPRLFSELDGGDLNLVARAIANKLDHDGQIFHVEMPWLYKSLPLEGDVAGKSVQAFVDALSITKKKAMINLVISHDTQLVNQIRSRMRRGKDMEDFELCLAFALKRMVATTQYKVATASQVGAKAHYTYLVAKNLYEGDYGALLKLLPDLADGDLSREQRVALFEVMRHFSPDFIAMGELMKKYGNSNQQVQLTRFDNVKDAFIHHFDPSLDASSVLDDILAALNDIGESVTGALADLRAMVGLIAQDMLMTLSWDKFTGADTDDNARQFIEQLVSMPVSGNINILSRLPTSAKQQLCGYCIDGVTLDEDEEAILDVLSTTRKSNRAEFFELCGMLSLTTLDDNIHGDEWDRFLSLLKC